MDHFVKSGDDYFKPAVLSPTVGVAQGAGEPDNDEDNDTRCSGATRSTDCAVGGVRRRSMQNHADKVHTRSLLSHSGCAPYTDTSCRPGARVRRGPEWPSWRSADGGDFADSLGTVISHGCDSSELDWAPPLGCWPTLPCSEPCGRCTVRWDKTSYTEWYYVGSDGSQLCWANETVGEDEDHFIDVRYA